MDSLRSPHTLLRSVARPAFRAIACLAHGRTDGVEVTALAGPSPAPVDQSVLALAVAAVDQCGHPAPLLADVSDAPDLRRLPATLSALVAGHRLDPAAVGVKVAATRAAADLDETAHLFSHLRAIGCPVGITGVGSSLASLRLLTMVEMDFAELSADLVAGMLAGPDALADAAAVLGRVADADLVAVAAGVSTHQQAEWLRDLGCQRGHGLYFGEPSHWLAPSTTHRCVGG